MFHLPRTLRHVVVILALFAALLPSVVQLLPAAHGQPLGLGELCSTGGHVRAPESGNPVTPDQDHQGHCLLCCIHVADPGLPPSISQWQAPGSVGIILPQASFSQPPSTVWLISRPRGPPVFS